MFNQFLLLAERNPFRDMASVVRDRREHFDPLELLPWLLVVVVLFGALAIVSRHLNRQDKRRLFNNPRVLFRALCRAHELDRADCRMLCQLAKTNGIEQPAALFLRPELFVAAMSAPEFQRQQAVIETLIVKLFDNDPTLTKAAPALTQATPAPAAARAPQPTAAGGSVSRHAPAIQAASAEKKPLGGQRRGAKPEVLHEDSSDDESMEAGPSISEQHAVRALEALMKQIHASREAAPTSPAERAAGASAGPARAANDQKRPLVVPDVAPPINDHFAHR